MKKVLFVFILLVMGLVLYAQEAILYKLGDTVRIDVFRSNGKGVGYYMTDSSGFKVATLIYIKKQKDVVYISINPSPNYENSFLCIIREGFYSLMRSEIVPGEFLPATRLRSLTNFSSVTVSASKLPSISINPKDLSVSITSYKSDGSVGSTEKIVYGENKSGGVYTFFYKDIMYIYYCSMVDADTGYLIQLHRGISKDNHEMAPIDSPSALGLVYITKK
jgi:hypothetical protein